MREPKNYADTLPENEIPKYWVKTKDSDTLHDIYTVAFHNWRSWDYEIKHF